jgi:hypothetical protein
MRAREAERFQEPLRCWKYVEALPVFSGPPTPVVFIQTKKTMNGVKELILYF